MHRLVGVRSTEARDIWPKVQSWIASACEEEGGSYLASDILAAVEAQDMQMWLAVNDVGEPDAVAITEIRNMPQRRICMVTIMTGRNLEAWSHLRHGVAKWAKANGIEGKRAFKAVARRGYLRLFKEFDCTHVLLEMDI